MNLSEILIGNNIVNISLNNINSEIKLGNIIYIILHLNPTNVLNKSYEIKLSNRVESL